MHDQMDQNIKNLFSMVKQKAHGRSVHPFDSVLYRLASYFTGGKHRAYYLGESEIRLENGSIKRRFSLLEWEEDSLKRNAMAIMTEDDRQDIGYNFYLFGEKQTGKRMSVYSTKLPLKDESFNMEMGMGFFPNHEMEKRFQYAMFNDAMMAEI